MLYEVSNSRNLFTFCIIRHDHMMMMFDGIDDQYDLIWDFAFAVKFAFALDLAA